MIGEAAVVAGSLRINAPAGAVGSLHGPVFEAAGIGGTAVILSARAALHAQSCVIRNFAEPGANGIQPQPLPIGSSAVPATSSTTAVATLFAGAMNTRRHPGDQGCNGMPPGPRQVA